MRPSWQPVVGPAIAALVAVGLLAPFLMLDPARGVTFSNAPFSDEAWNLIGARNLVIFGRPATDEWRLWLLAVPFTVVHAAAFAIFGVSLEVARAVMIGIVAITGGMIVAALQGRVGRANALLAGLAFVTSGLVLYYGRMAFLEPLVGVFLAAGVLTLKPATGRRAIAWGIAGGVALALAVMTKAVAAPSVAGILVVAGIAAIRQPWARRWLAGAVPSGGAIGLAWLFLVILPHRPAIRTIVKVVYPPYQLPADLGELVRHAAALPFADGALLFAFPLAVIALVGAGRIIRSVRRDGFEPGLVAPVATLVGLLGGLGALGIVDYQPNRYLVAFLPLAAILSGWLPRLPLWRPATGFYRIPIAALVFVFAAAPGIAMHATWLRDGGHEVERIQALALATLPPGARIAGQYAPLVALGAEVRTIVPFESVNDGDLYRKGVRYLIWVDGGPRWMAAHPEAWAGRRVLGCMTWSKLPERSCLYELPDEP